MMIDLPADQVAFIGRLVASGRFSSANAVIQESLRLLVSRERLKKQLQMGIEQADRNEVIDHDTVFAQLKAPAGALLHPSSFRRHPFD